MSGTSLTPVGSHPTLAERAIELCRALRQQGVVATPGESVEAARALEVVDIVDRNDVYLALRALFTTRREDLAVFDVLFDQWWSAAAGGDADSIGSAVSQHELESPRSNVARRDDGRPGKAADFLSKWASESDAGDDAVLPMAAPSAIDSRTTKDFAAFTSEELADVERIAAFIARRLNARPSRRWRPAYRGTGTRLDLRRTFRLSLATGGDAFELARRERKPRRTKLVALCDVSGSMDLYSRFLLQFLYALQHAFARVETFAFSTQLRRISDALARDSYRSALDALAREVPGWSGGTRIGESVASFLAGWPRLVDRRTVVIVLSDGWDTGDSELLADAMRTIHRRAGRVVWLNPLLGSESYQPLTAGMQAALPHVDVFAPAHNLASLEALARHLAL
jgi:uncharacterized protein